MRTSRAETGARCVLADRKGVESLHARHLPTQSSGDPPQDDRGQRHAVFAPGRKGIAMNIHISHTILAPVVSLIAGVLILVMPRLLNYIVALYLIVIGLIGLFGSGTLFR